MRIIQLSDIHLSSDNQNDLSNFYLNSLITDLKEYHNKKPIDVIILTGDLVDKGGASLGSNPYLAFAQSFLNPIISALSLRKNQILFIPGNHDIDRDSIHEDNEYFLSNTLTENKANEILKKQRDQIQNSNERIEKFKKFEREFHSDTKDYIFSLNESLAIYDSETYRIGFALINDSWRCSPSLIEEKHYIGSHQLFNAKTFFSEKKTDINIAIFHHPLDAINPSERDTIQNILKSSDFNIAFFGHSHQYKFESILSSSGGYVTIRGRSAFNKYDELQSKYQPGYNVIDLDVKNSEYTIHGRKFIIEGYRFDKDVESFKDGQYNDKLLKPSHISISRDSTSHDIDLPSGYKADVDKIVKLLIGKSLYPDPYTFVRELIQNSVDACNRVKDKHSELSPQIIVHINTEENSFEIIDEGDGMSKKIIREHFSIIGKSISQEFVNNNNTNLISQFGIGFISTFIVADKIFIQTKSEDDDIIIFTIEDVFKGFDYKSSSENIKFKSTGTCVKVYLKRSFPVLNALNQINYYCRHINNSSYFLNEVQQLKLDSWNVENGVFNYEINKLNYNCKLTIGNDTRALISSNSGFFINDSSQQLLPFLFPFIIGGEVVFKPKCIDLDLSRTTIISSQKSDDFKKDISIYLVKSFRDVLESKKDESLKQKVIDYLQYYLTNYDNIEYMIRESYIDFYSKSDLIKLCSEHIIFDYDNKQKSLSEIIFLLKERGIAKIFAHNGAYSNDLKPIVATYLQGIGNLVIYNRSSSVPFREGSRQVSTLQCVQIIAWSVGFQFIDLDTIIDTEIKNISVDKKNLSVKVLNVIDSIEKSLNIVIEIAHLGTHYNKFLNIGNRYLVNYDNNAIQNIIMDSKNISEQYVEVYLMGVLGIDLSFSSLN